MHENLSTNRKLLIISDTAMFLKEKHGFAFGPVVNEIEYIHADFEDIIWIGFNRVDRHTDLSMKEITVSKIKLILLKPIGGKGLVSFLKVLCQYPRMLYIIMQHLKNASIVHTRGPSHPALIGILSSYLFKNKIWWHKYAGNWIQKSIPLSYNFQRLLLKNARHTNVTINGHWPNQPAHCHSFENPCLTDEQITLGKRIRLEKQFEPPFVFAFVGRLEEAKGVSTLIEALQHIPLNYIKDIHMVGDGVGLENYKIIAQFLGEKIQFHGSLASEKVHALLKDVHFFLLPSKSEGFPKVIAEAACYGAIPVVSKVGSIDQYISNENGFLWDTEGVYSYSEVLKTAVYSNPDSLTHKSEALIRVASKFTFLQYYKKLEKILFEK